MTRIETGMTVRYNGNGEHAYAGDLFECPSCGSVVVSTVQTPYFDQGAKTQSSMDVWMDVDGKGYEPNK